MLKRKINIDLLKHSIIFQLTFLNEIENEKKKGKIFLIFWGIIKKKHKKGARMRDEKNVWFKENLMKIFKSSSLLLLLLPFSFCVFSITIVALRRRRRIRRRE